MKKTIIVTTAALMVLAVSCGQSKKNNGEQTPLPAMETTEQTKVESHVVYAVGFETLASGRQVATLWIDGEPMRLADEELDSDANSVFVTDDNTIYVAGEIDVVATLWKINENEITSLTLEKPKRYYSELKEAYLNTGSAAYSVFVIPTGDVYLSGTSDIDAVVWTVSGTKITRQTLSRIENFDAASAHSIYVTAAGNFYAAGYQRNYDRQWFASLWKNGEMYILTEAEQTANAHDVHVTNEDIVYVAGDAVISDKQVAVTWKNQKIEPLTCSSDETSACANAVFVTDNGDVYAAGYEINKEWNFTAVVWKNNKKQILLNDGERTRAESVYVTEQGDVYVAGYKGKTAALWKNENLQLLTNGSNMAIARCVFVK